MSSQAVFLAGDIGGTNSRLSLCSESRDVLRRETFRNDDYDSLAAVLRAFNPQEQPAAACFAVAGPVRGGAATLSNRPQWGKLREGDLAESLGCPVSLINDFVANGYGLLTLAADEVEVLQEAPVQRDAPIACIGAGTGLGVCFLTPDGRCWPSEGGNADFAPRTPQESALLEHLRPGPGRALSTEAVVSGPGMAAVYGYLGGGDVDGAEVSRRASAGDALAGEALDIVFSAYGSAAGSTALQFLCYGGLYITGGLAAAHLPRLRGPFMDAFAQKDRVAEVLPDVPVFAVLVEELGERGARYVATMA